MYSSILSKHMRVCLSNALLKTQNNHLRNELWMHIWAKQYESFVVVIPFDKFWISFFFPLDVFSNIYKRPKTKHSRANTTIATNKIVFVVQFLLTFSVALPSFDERNSNSKGSTSDIILKIVCSVRGFEVSYI